MHHKSGRDPRTGPEKVGIGSGRFGFIDEGLATFFEGHHWDRETDTLRVGVPGSQSRARGAFRRASGREATFRDLIASPRDYAEVWGLMHYLVHNRPKEARAILSNPDDPANVWESVFGSLDVSEDFHRDYLAWLKKMGEGPAHVCETRSPAFGPSATDAVLRADRRRACGRHRSPPSATREKAAKPAIQEFSCPPVCGGHPNSLCKP